MPQPLDPLVLCSVCLLLFSNSTKILILEEDRITKLSAPAGRNIGWALRVSLADGREKKALIIQNEKANTNKKIILAGTRLVQRS